MPPSCKYGSHPMDADQARRAVYYQDDAHGIPDLILTCPDCYNAHILRYFPNSAIAAHIRRNIPDTILPDTQLPIGW